MFAITQAVLDERNFVAREKIKIAATLFGDVGDFGAVGSDITPMPEGGGEGVRVADQEAVGVARGGIFAALLFVSDHDEFGGAPVGVVGRDFCFGIFAAEFSDPGGVQCGGDRLGEGGGAGRFGAEHANALGEPGAHGRFQKMPARRAAGTPAATAEEKALLKRRRDLAGDIITLQEKTTAIHALMPSMGGRITVEDSRKLILKKHHDLVASQLQRYVQAEERALFGIFENLFDKYAVSAKTLEKEREATLGELEGILAKLSYA